MTEDSKLWASLYLDEDVSHLLGDLLARRGFSVLTVAGEGRLGKTDDEQLDYAASLGHVLLTYNRGDYDRIAKEWQEQGRTHAGIILMVRRSVYDVCASLTELLNTVTADDMVDQVRYV